MGTIWDLNCSIEVDGCWYMMIYVASTSFPIKQMFATLDVRIQNHIPLFVTAPAHIMATINQLPDCHRVFFVIWPSRSRKLPGMSIWGHKHITQRSRKIAEITFLVFIIYRRPVLPITLFIMSADVSGVYSHKSQNYQIGNLSNHLKSPFVIFLWYSIHLYHLGKSAMTSMTAWTATLRTAPGVAHQRRLATSPACLLTPPQKRGG